MVTAMSCLAALIAINFADAGEAPTAGTRSAIELIGGGKSKKSSLRLGDVVLARP